jgi:hypothetical protein
MRATIGARGVDSSTAHARLTAKVTFCDCGHFALAAADLGLINEMDRVPRIPPTPPRRDAATAKG